MRDAGCTNLVVAMTKTYQECLLERTDGDGSVRKIHRYLPMATAFLGHHIGVRFDRTVVHGWRVIELIGQPTTCLPPKT